MQRKDETSWVRVISNRSEYAISTITIKPFSFRALQLMSIELLNLVWKAACNFHVQMMKVSWRHPIKNSIIGSSRPFSFHLGMHHQISLIMLCSTTNSKRIGRFSLFRWLYKTLIKMLQYLCILSITWHIPTCNRSAIIRYIIDIHSSRTVLH